MNKLAIISAGRVGDITAQILAEQDRRGEVVLIELREDFPHGVASGRLVPASHNCNGDHAAPS